MSHIVFLTPYYPPEVGAPQTRISETAVRLVRRGHTVTVLTTFPNYPLGIVPPEYRGMKTRRESIEGVNIIRVWSYISPNKGFLRRIIAQLSFGCLAPLLAGSALARPDIIIVESPPLFDAIAGRMLARRHRCPFIFTIADIWPESAVQLGALRNKLLIRLAEWLEWSTYRRAGAVWAVTSGIRDILVQRGLASEQVFLLTNGVNIDKFRSIAYSQARAELEPMFAADAFIVLYAGTIGMAHGLQVVLDAAEKLSSYPDIRIVLVGEGAAKADLVAQAEQRALTNVAFLAAQPHDRMPLIIASANACLVALRKLPLFEGALPSKMYEAMACARPILLAVDGEARKRIEQEAGAALYVEPENAQALADSILYLRDHPAVAEEIGLRGRQYVEIHFNRDHLVSALEARIAALLGQENTVVEMRASENRLESASQPK